MPPSAKTNASNKLVQTTLHDFTAPSPSIALNSELASGTSAQRVRKDRKDAQTRSIEHDDDIRAVHEPDVLILDESEADVPRPPKRKSTRKVVIDSQDNDHVPSADDVEENSDSSDRIRRTKRREAASKASDSESEEDIQPKRVVRGHRPSSADADDEDEDDPMDGIDENSEQRSFIV